MYELYYSPGACSLAIHVLLNEIGAPVELKKVNLRTGENRSPEFLAVNPRGQVPVLVDGDKIFRESAFIMVYLIEKHKSPLLLNTLEGRMNAMEWLTFINSSLHPAYGRMFFLMKNTQDATAKEQLTKLSLAMINKLWAEIDVQLARTRYLAGDEITAADILLTVIAGWDVMFAHPATLGKNVLRLLKDVSSRPSFQKALEEEGIAYKRAA